MNNAAGWIEAFACVAGVLITIGGALVGIGGLMLSIKSHSDRIVGLESRERNRIESEREREERLSEALGEIRENVATLLERTADKQ